MIVYATQANAHGFFLGLDEYAWLDLLERPPWRA